MQGTIERVDSKKIVVSFKVDDYEGIPTITLVAPGKSIDLNWLENVDINGVKPATLSENPTQCGIPPVNCVHQADWMFGKRPSGKDFRIDSLEVFRTASGDLSALVHGAGFKPQPPSHSLFVNGVPQAFVAVSSELIAVSNIPAPSGDIIQVTLVYGDDTTSSEAVDNPAFMKVNKVSIVSYEEGTDKKAGVLVVKLEGMGFPLKLNSSEPKRIKVTVASQQDAYLSILNPSEAEVVTLIDPITKIEINTVITRKSPPK